MTDLAALIWFIFSPSHIGHYPRTISNIMAEDTSRAPIFSNPVLWEDLADLDVFRVDSAYYYSASTMHYSPGAPVLRSYDLINWEYIGHSLPTLGFPGLSTNYNLTNNQRAYVKGVYASSLRYRLSNGLWYWIGCIEYTHTYVYTAPSPSGPWIQRSKIDTCYYDCGLLIDDDDTMYVAYGGTNISVAQLTPDGLSEAKTTPVWNSPDSIGTVEGNRFYKRDGKYYILVDHPANAEYVLMSSSVLGPYSYKVLVNSIVSPVSGSGNPHQGGLVDTPSGDWYYMAFIDSYPGGRVPVLAPVTWGNDGFPVVTTVNGDWGKQYPYPVAPHPLPSLIGTDYFPGNSLSQRWEWNHNPDLTKFKVHDGLRLYAATITEDIYQARNTLTHRIHGPQSRATIVIDYRNMFDGDRAGFSLFRDQSAWIGIERNGHAFTIVMKNGINMNTDWTTNNTGVIAASKPISKGNVWLQITADIRSGGTYEAGFAYSTNGLQFTSLGPTFEMDTAWQFFMGYRWGIFNYATKSLGGWVDVLSFTQE
ncbi:family 43 glycosyl hydrolase [Xylogone sp. PMI_703]|nr:family 43 glycosyl hydrolase [Xylogone sp. PMI_703]